MADKLEEALRKLKEASLKWHVGDNLRWLADQSDRPGHVPCGMLTGAFLITVADNYEQLTKEEREAADEITRLNALVDELVEGLEPFALGDHGIEDIRRARALICRVKGVKAATVPSAKVPRQTHG